VITKREQRAREGANQRFDDDGGGSRPLAMPDVPDVRAAGDVPLAPSHRAFKTRVSDVASSCLLMAWADMKVVAPA
jgi:hypothetical protein